MTGDYEIALKSNAKPFAIATPYRIPGVSKLDADSACQAVTITDDLFDAMGQILLNRVPQGISSAPEVFQAGMIRMLDGLSNVVCHMDDILICGSTVEEHDKYLLVVLQRINEHSMTLNREKCAFRTKKVKFLGHLLENGQIRADPTKTETIAKMEPLTSKSKLVTPWFH